MSDVERRCEYADTDRNVAANLRHFREQAGLSQDELAQRMNERGFEFTQTTIGKIESGQRPVKISEIVALGDTLGLFRWTYLMTEPRVGLQIAEMQAASSRAHQAYGVLKMAAGRYIEEQVDVLLSVRRAQVSGLEIDEMWTAWLGIPAERAVIEARVDMDRADEVVLDRHREVDTALEALRKAGYEPLRPEDLVIDSGEFS
jgi:transcriptional regulator with XRE-family HTH domain